MLQSNIHDFWEQVTELSEQENFAAVKELCDKALRLYADDADALIIRSISHTNLGNGDEALADMQRALTIHPCPYLYLKRSELYEALADSENCIADLKVGAALEANPNICSSHGNSIERGYVTFMLAKSLVDRGRQQEALATVSRCLEINPNLARALALRADLHIHFGHTQRAFVDLDRSIELDQNCHSSYLVRAKFYWNNGDYHSAVEDLTTILELDPNDVFALVLRADCLFYLEEIEDAIEDCNQAIEIDPEYATAYMERASAFFALEEYEDALSDLQIHTQLVGENQMVEMYGICHAELGNNRSALDYLNKAVAEGPHDEFRVYQLRSAAYAAIGEDERAIEDLSRCITLNPIDAQVLFRRGTLHNLRGDYTAALGDLTKAINLEPTGEAFCERGYALEKLDRWLESIEDTTKAIDLSPTQPHPLLLARARAYGMLGRLHEAEQDLSKFIDSQPEESDLFRLVDAHAARKNIREALGKVAEAQLDADAVARLQACDSQLTNSNPINLSKLDMLFHQSILLSRAKQRRLMDFVATEFGENWRFDIEIDKSSLTFRPGKQPLQKIMKLFGPKIELEKQIVVELQSLSTMLESTQEWLWSWANSQTPDNASESARVLRELGKKLKILELQDKDPFLVDADLSHQLITVGSVFCDCDAVFMNNVNNLECWFLLRSPLLALGKDDYKNLDVLHAEYMTVLETEPLRDHRLVLTSYLEQRQINFTSTAKVLRIEDGAGQHLEYWFNQNTLLRAETGFFLN